MGWVLGILGGFAALVVAAMIIGSTFPRDHSFTRTLRLKKAPDEVWRRIADFAGQGAWNPIVRSAERLADKDGHEVWKEKSRHGPPMTLETLESTPPKRLVRSIADEKQAFSGRWEFDLEAVEGGCRIRLTENGTVPNPFFRFMVRAMGPGKYVEDYLRGLAKQFGEAAVFE